jgi:hypothetical protein
MAGRGAFQAISVHDMERLLAEPLDDDEIWDFTHELDSLFHVYPDKAWQGKHLCLADGTFDCDGGEYPLNCCVLGEELICETESADYVYLKRPQAVIDIANAILPITRDTMRQRYDKIDPGEYRTFNNFEIDDDNFEYVWSYFQQVQAFYHRAAAERLAVLFSWG